VTGRERSGTLVHIGTPEGCPRPQVGDVVTCTVTHAGKHYLIADPDPRLIDHRYTVRR
jgi:tRNA-2-methylthio-N6-dimethylallyladenosine synthase